MEIPEHPLWLTTWFSWLKSFVKHVLKEDEY